MLEAQGYLENNPRNSSLLEFHFVQSGALQLKNSIDFPELVQRCTCQSLPPCWGCRLQAASRLIWQKVDGTSHTHAVKNRTATDAQLLSLKAKTGIQSLYILQLL